MFNQIQRDVNTSLFTVTPASVGIQNKSAMAIQQRPIASSVSANQR